MPGLAEGDADGDGLAPGDEFEFELVTGWQAVIATSESRVRRIMMKL
jgi:hypothetical protein